MSEQDDKVLIENDKVLGEIRALRETLGRRYGAAEVETLIDPLLGMGPDGELLRHRILHALQALQKIQRRLDDIESARTRAAGDHGAGGFPYDDPRAHAVAEMRGPLADFARNGRWGTCGGCPCDGYGRKLPELCHDTLRADHQLDVDGLARRFKHELAGIEKKTAS